MTTVDTFTGQMKTLGVGFSRVAAIDLADELATLADDPVVASPLDVHGAELPRGVDEKPSSEALGEATTGITPAAFGIAEYGTVAVTPTAAEEGSVSLFPPFHIAVVQKSNVVRTMDDGFERLTDLFAAGTNDVVLVTGPSSTGDMGELVRGVHGPAEMHVVVVEDR